MKFVCERCHTKYSIADDKVRQKILKIRCKTCENVITIRDAVVVNEAGPQRAAPPPAPNLNAPRSVEWHLAVNGRQDGPLGLAALVTRILGAGRGDEVYVWNEHLDGWKEPKSIPEVAAEMRARASAGVPPVPPGARRAPTPAAGGRAHLPPPGGTGRSSASMPAVSARGAGSRGGGAAAAAAYAPISEQEELGEKTQISSLDASLLAPEAAPKLSARHTAVPTSFPALADLSVSLPLPGSSASNGSTARPLPGGGSGLEALDFVPVPVAASSSGAKRTGGFVAAPAAGGVVAAPVIGGSTSMLLSQIGGRVARVRHPAIKYVVIGGVVVSLIIVVAVLSITGGEKKLDNRPAIAATNPSTAGDPEATARAEAEKYFKSMVGEEPAKGGGNTTSKSIGPPRRHSPPARGRASTDNTRPPALAPPPVGSTPAPAEGGGVARRFGLDERRVIVPGKESGGASVPKASFDQGKFMGVFRQQHNHTALKSCYDRALKRDPKLRLGRLDITVGVAEAGSVRMVKVNAPPEFSAVSSCMQSTVRRWRFPPTGEYYEATFTMLLHGSTE